MIEQGPGPGIPDNPFSEIRLVNGRKRGFSASATSYAIDGANPSDMSGTPRPVLVPREAGELRGEREVDQFGAAIRK